MLADRCLIIVHIQYVSGHHRLYVSKSAKYIIYLTVCVWLWILCGSPTSDCLLDVGCWCSWSQIPHCDTVPAVHDELHLHPLFTLSSRSLLVTEAVLCSVNTVQAVRSPTVSLIPIGNGESAPADLVMATQLDDFKLRPKQLAWLLNVSAE